MTHHCGVTTLRPLPITRIANGAPGFALALPAFWVAARVPVSMSLAVALPWLAVSAVGVVRGYRMSVTVTDDTVVVRGLLRSRTLPRGCVCGVTFIPAVRWRSASGRLRWTPVTAFADLGGSLASVSRHNDACVERLVSLLGSAIGSTKATRPAKRRVGSERRT